MARLEGKIAVVTGASRGIGRAIAHKLAAEKATVVCTATTEKGAKATVDEIVNAGMKAEAVSLDISDANQIQTLVAETVKNHGQIDVWINNAGITRDNLLVRMSEDDWQTVINVNLTGVYQCMKAVARPMMRKRTGKIINISSVVGQVGNPGQANYSAAKAGVIAMSKSIAKELSARNIQVNCIAPGYIQTDMTGELPDTVKEQILSTIPMGRMGAPEDVAHLAAFLASSESDYITGQVFNVDGGMVMQ